MKTILKVATWMLLSLIIFLTTITIGYADTPKRGGTLSATSEAFPRHFNIAIQSSPVAATPGTQIFAALLDFDENWQPIPYLAKSWEQSDDSLTYTFHIIKGATFHDGEPITSEDVAFSFDMVKKNHPFGRSMFAAVDRVETPDPYTVVFKLSRPHPALMLSLSPMLMPVIPKHVYSTGPIRKHPANVKPIGSGPFKLVEFKPNDYYILERHENYFRPGLPYLDRIICKWVKDMSASEIAFRQGKFHYTPFNGGLNNRSILRLKKVEHLVVTTRGYAALGPMAFVEFNVRKPPFDDVRVRRAIAYSIDKEFIIHKLHQGLSKRATGPIPSTFRFYTDDVNRYDLDLDKANKLLDEAGYPRKANGVRFSATLDCAPVQSEDMKVAEYLKPQLRKVGIDVQLRPPVDYGTWTSRMARWEYDFTMSVYLGYGDPVVGVDRKYLSDNIKHVVWTNTGGYSNPKVDEILKEAAVEMDFEKRKAHYAEFQKIVTDDVPLAYTHEPNLHTIYHKDLRNVPIGIWGGMGPFDKVYWKDGREPQ